MPPELTWYPDAAAFLEQVQPFLLQNEAVNSLLLGVARLLGRRGVSRRHAPPLLASVSTGDAIDLAVVMTPPRKMLVSSHRPVKLSAVSTLVEELLDSAYHVPGVLGPAPWADAMRESWAGATGRSTRPGIRQRLFRLERVELSNRRADGRLAAATEADMELLTEWIGAFQAEALPNEPADAESTRLIAERIVSDGDLFLWRTETEGQDRIVSMAARSRPLEKGISVNLVFTPVEYRGRGYATACVASLSQKLLDDGWSFCTLFTDLSNPVSNHIYERIGYKPITDFNEYWFD